MSVSRPLIRSVRFNVPFRDLGADYYDSFNRDRKIHGYLKRLKALGWEPDAPPELTIYTVN